MAPNITHTLKQNAPGELPVPTISIRPPPWGFEVNINHILKQNAPGETRTPNHLIRSQVLYPLSYEGKDHYYTIKNEDEYKNK